MKDVIARYCTSCMTLRVSNISQQVDSCLILLYVIVQAQDYRLGHIHASMAATLVLDVIASEAKQSTKQSIHRVQKKGLSIEDSLIQSMQFSSF